MTAVQAYNQGYFDGKNNRAHHGFSEQYDGYFDDYEQGYEDARDENVRALGEDFETDLA